MQQSGGETFFRAVVMGSVLGLMGWAAFRFTTLPQMAVQQAIIWYETADAQHREQQEVPAAGTANFPQPGGPQPSALGPFTPPALLPTGPAPTPVPQNAVRLDGIEPESDPPTYRAQPAGYNQPIAHSPLSPANLRPSPVPLTLSAVDVDDERTAIERRLRKLGAVYSLLEMWQRDGSVYRFHCQVAVAGNAQVTRSFEATGGDPQQLMRQVLRDVEAWRALDVPVLVEVP